MSEDTQLLRQIRDLLLVIAEPALAERDKKLRAQLVEIVGKSKQKAKAVLLMDGNRTQTQIVKEAGIDAGALSRCVKALREAALIGKDEKHPKLSIAIPSNVFEGEED
jgi:regulator of protease activity HflC (stomatin/prohibitin superfamily)